MADLYAVTAKDLEFAPVNEVQKKRLARDEKLYADKLAAEKSREADSKKLLSEMQGKLEKYEAEYAAAIEEDARLKKEALAKGGFYKPAAPKVLLIVRIKGVNKLCPRVRKIFQLFRLLQIHNAVFVQINKATLNMIRHIRPFCAFGYPNVETIRKLIYKRGYLRVGKQGHRQRIRITDNMQIKDLLGEKTNDRICGVEDMVHEIATCGSNFTDVNRALWTFKLHGPRGGYLQKRNAFSMLRKGDYGNRADHINDFAQRML